VKQIGILIKLKSLGAKLLILPFIALNGLGANAALYKYTFAVSNYVDQDTPPMPGTISGFFVLDTTQAALDAKYLGNNGGNDFAIPSWITQAELTFTADVGSGLSSETRSLTSANPLTDISWQVADASTFDPSQEFVSQMSAFSFDNGGSFGTSFGAMVQEYSYIDPNTNQGVGGEFLF